MIIFFDMYIVPFLLSLILHSVWTKLLQIILFHWYLFVFCIFYLFYNIFCETVFYILNFGESNRMKIFDWQFENGDLVERDIQKD